MKSALHAINASSQPAFVLSTFCVKPSNSLLLVPLLLVLPCDAQPTPLNDSYWSPLNATEKMSRCLRRPRPPGIPDLASPSRGALRSGGLASAALLLRSQTHQEPLPLSKVISGERQVAATAAVPHFALSPSTGSWSAT